ncbi:MAG: hypothetical protein LKF37_05685 [Lentilactobacillus diolivorans]|jgi:hypothetical protein|nr:hypothetical protein [Lentilactobacillus diolivorans]RRG01364.1 MAG: hypothetical protein DUD34_12310 [Lactobacillus sp.]
MNETDILKRNVQNIAKTNDIEYKRSLLYSGYATLLLSTKLFKLNIDLKDFLTPLLTDLEKEYPLRKNQTLVLKDYVYKSRSLIISRIIRIIQNADAHSLSILEKSYSSLILQDNKPISKKKTNSNRPNSVDELFERFNRK